MATADPPAGAEVPGQVAQPVAPRRPPARADRLRRRQRVSPHALLQQEVRLGRRRRLLRRRGGSPQPAAAARGNGRALGAVLAAARGGHVGGAVAEEGQVRGDQHRHRIRAAGLL